MGETNVRKLNLLILDDDPAVVRLVQSMLQRDLGDRLCITTRTDSEAARQWIDENCCDLLISDIEMPGLDGMEVLKFAKRRNAWTQVLFLTGHSTWDRIAEAIENGASDYLLKPIRREDLVAVVSQLCDRFARWESAVLETLDAAPQGAC